MKRLFTSIITLLATLPMLSQGWPAQYEGVMLQGFYWDGYADSQWTVLEAQADELSKYFKLVWIPQSGNCGGKSMGYDDLYWFPGHYDSSFGTEAELRSMINTFKSKGIGTIADVVINHRRNVSNWVDFPAETYKGVTYQLKSTDICADDDGGKTKTWATQNGYSLSANNDTGEGWGGMRDLDHKSTNVQDNVKAYVKMLLEDMGYAGFRYDMVKGYSASYTQMYNEYSKPIFSVGECWDATKVIRDWIDGTNKTSAAFDFQFRYTVRNAINNNNWVNLGNTNGNYKPEGSQKSYANWPLVSNSYKDEDKDNTYNYSYRQYAVTFVENHDTERRPDAEQDPLRKDTLAANAYLLAMPGTPCIFLTHWIDCKRHIKAMIDVRNAVGLHNTSTYEKVASKASSSGYYAVATTGKNGKLLAVVGNTGATGYIPNANWVCVHEGYHYAYYLEKSMNMVWVDLSDGEYDGEQEAMLTAVSSDSGAQLVYTTDGSTPTASSKMVASGTKITIPVGSTTLKVGLLIGNTVSGVVTKTYQINEVVPFVPYSISVYVNTSKVNWNEYVNFHSWGNKRSGTTWPGDKVTTTTTIGEKKWYYKTYQINSEDDYVNFVFSVGTSANANQNQTVDVNKVNTDKFFEISDEKSNGKYLVNDVTGSYTSVEPIVVVPNNQPAKIFTLDGRQVTTPKRGLYIVNGKKVIVK